MSPLNQPLQPYYNEFLRCAICSHDFQWENSLYRPITLPICGHTMCGQCIDIIRHQTKCPQDQISFASSPIPLDQLPTNYPLLIILYDSLQLPEDDQERYGQCLSYMKLDDEGKSSFHRTQMILGEIALLIKPIVNDKDCQSILSRPMIRKIFSLLNCQYIDRDGRMKALKAARSLGERTCIDFILHHQNPQQLTANLWSAVRARGCQFLGPAMQEEVLKLILLALEDGSALSRKVLVLFVVQKLAPQYPRASKTSVGHVVQLLYRASCFKVQKREEESSLMQLKSEFRNYESLRREHDSQIIQIAMEAGLRISPEQWSSLLYGDTQHKSSMQSIIDKLSTPASFSQAIQEFLIVLQRAGESSKYLSSLKTEFEQLAQIDLANSDQQNLSEDHQADQDYWTSIVSALESVKTVLQALIEFNWQEMKINHSNKTSHHQHHHHHYYHHRPYDLSSTTITSSTSCSSPLTVSPIGGSSTTSEYQIQPLPPPNQLQQNHQMKYKVSMCRDYIQKHSCPRGAHCTFAHSKAEMDKYRAKSRHPNGSILPLTTPSTNPMPSSAQPGTALPMFPSNNPNHLIRPMPPTTLLPIWNPQQQTNPIQDLPQQHHHHHYYHPSQLPPSLLHYNTHPSTSYEHHPTGTTSNTNPNLPPTTTTTNNNNNSQIPVIAAAAQALLEQNNAAAAIAANAFYRFQQQQHQQNPSMPYHPPSSMMAPPLSQQGTLPSRLPNNVQATSNPIQSRAQSFSESRFSSLSDSHHNHSTAPVHFPHIEDLRLPPVLPLNGNNSTDHSVINARNYSALQPIPPKTDENLLYFPSINQHLNRPGTSFLTSSTTNHSNTNTNATTSLFNDILSNTNNPLSSSLSTNTFVPNRQAQHQPSSSSSSSSFKPLSTMTFTLPHQPIQSQAAQQQSQLSHGMRNDENVFHSIPHPTSSSTTTTTFDDEDYSLINVSNPGAAAFNSNESSFFYFGSANAHATAAYNFYHPNSPLGGNGHSLKA